MIHVKREKIEYQNAGDPILIKYSSKVMDDGKIQLIPSGKVNIQEKIDSYRDSCDINIILRRLKNGDLSVMDAFNASPIYGDFVDMPKSYREVLQFTIDAQKHFDELPAEIKAKFDNDYNEFMATAGTEDWMNKLKVEEKGVEVINGEE